MTIEKNIWADIQDGVTQGLAAAELVNGNKRAVNEVIDVVNPLVDQVDLMESNLNSLDSQVDSIQDTVDGLGTASTMTNASGGDTLGTASTKNAATEAQVIAGTAGVLTDAEQVRRNHVAQVATIADLRALEPAFDGQQVIVKGFHAGSHDGGGTFYWDPNKSKSSHNGGSIIDPDAPFPEDWDSRISVLAWFNSEREGAGCFIATTPTSYADNFGLFPGDATTPAFLSSLAVAKVSGLIYRVPGTYWFEDDDDVTIPDGFRIEATVSGVELRGRNQQSDFRGFANLRLDSSIELIGVEFRDFNNITVEKLPGTGKQGHLVSVGCTYTRCGNVFMATHAANSPAEYFGYSRIENSRNKYFNCISPARHDYAADTCVMEGNEIDTYWSQALRSGFNFGSDPTNRGGGNGRVIIHNNIVRNAIGTDVTCYGWLAYADEAFATSNTLDRIGHLSDFEGNCQLRGGRATLIGNIAKEVAGCPFMIGLGATGTIIGNIHDGRGIQNSSLLYVRTASCTVFGNIGFNLNNNTLIYLEPDPAPDSSTEFMDQGGFQVFGNQVTNSYCTSAVRYTESRANGSDGVKTSTLVSDNILENLQVDDPSKIANLMLFEIFPSYGDNPILVVRGNTIRGNMVGSRAADNPAYGAKRGIYVYINPIAPSSPVEIELGGNVVVDLDMGVRAAGGTAGVINPLRLGDARFSRCTQELGATSLFAPTKIAEVPV